MPTVGTLLAFTAAATLLIVVPGPMVLYVVGRSVSQGRSHGLLSAVGSAVGVMVHTAAAAFGISVVIARSAIAFSALKYLGAAYLIVLGVQKLRSRSAFGEPAAGATRQTLRRTFGEAFVVQVLNPKTALFFLALLPQFVDAESGSAAAQVVVLGALFAVLALMCDSTWAFISSAAAERLRRSERALHRLDRSAGFVFIGLGVLAAVAERPDTQR